MAKKDLKRDPHGLGDDVWWYEEMKGIELHVETESIINNREGHKTIMIPWAQIRGALERKDKPA